MHTPGPWHIGGRTILRPTFTIFRKPFGLDDVAEVYEEADARLIAKAPDLKAALAWALDQIEDDLDPDHQSALAHARSLLED